MKAKFGQVFDNTNMLVEHGQIVLIIIYLDLVKSILFIFRPNATLLVNDIQLRHDADKLP